jgi:hypothetical protein
MTDPERPADDATGDLLRAVLNRQAQAVHPSGDGLARILAAAHGPGHPPRAPQAGAPDTGSPPAHDASAAVTVPVEVRAGRLQLPRWAPALAAAAAVVLVAGGLGLTQLGALQAPELANVINDPASSAPASHPPIAPPLPIYFLQRQNGRWALVREFTPTTLVAPEERLVKALRLAVRGTGTDTDHTSAWAEAGIRASADGLTATSAREGIVITLTEELLAATPAARRSSGDAPDETLASLAVAQLVWTASATAQDTRPIRIEAPSAGGRLFGEVPLGRVFERSASAVDDPRAPIWVSSLVDRQKLTAGAAVIQGDAVRTAHSGTIAWRLLDRTRDRQVGEGTVPLRREDGALPGIGERGLWRVTVELPDSGRYEFQTSQPWPDAAGRQEAWSPRSWVDTKILIVS